MFTHTEMYLRCIVTTGPIVEQWEVFCVHVSCSCYMPLRHSPLPILIDYYRRKGNRIYLLRREVGSIFFHIIVVFICKIVPHIFSRVHFGNTNFLISTQTFMSYLGLKLLCLLQNQKHYY